ncbi:MAG: hypothetical protein OEY15_14605, partial [Myxococcales bacterium]|nr:hypothetical protein [Myxococcales bacterium]
VLGDSALLTGYARGFQMLGADVIEEVARDLHLSAEGAGNRQLARSDSTGQTTQAAARRSRRLWSKLFR